MNQALKKLNMKSYRYGMRKLNHLERQYLKFYKYEMACKDPVKRKALFKQVIKLSKMLCEAKQRND